MDAPAAACPVEAAERYHKVGLQVGKVSPGMRVGEFGGSSEGVSGSRKERKGIDPASFLSLEFAFLERGLLHTAPCMVLKGCQFRLCHFPVTNTFKLDKVEKGIYWLV